MQKQTLSFDQLPEYVYELGRKVDYLTSLLDTPNNQADEIGGIELAHSITRLSKPRIYTLVSERKIPHSKRGNRLFFTRSQLTAWVLTGNRQQKEVSI